MVAGVRIAVAVVAAADALAGAVADRVVAEALTAGRGQEAAQAEASRCLQCGLICYEHAQEPASLEETNAGLQS